MKQYATTIQSKYTFTSKDSVAFESYRHLKSLQIEALNDGRDMSQLDSAEVLELKSIADTNKAIAGYQAQSILNYFYGYDYFVDAILPETSAALKTKSTENITMPSKQSLEPREDNRYSVQVIPNPVKGVCILRYEIPESASSAYIRIQNMEGRVVKEHKLDVKQEEWLWDTSDLKPGAYLCSLLVEGKVKASQLFVKL